MSRTKNNERPIPSGKAIRKALIDIDQSPVDLARAMGVSPYYIREIYAERRKATGMRRRIAEYLAVELKRRGYYLPMWARDKETAA
ncbi:MAG TPA: hypothetical protein PL124_13005 [Candidatus Cloacimonadota bacterium]|nr:hypothetical protein [Candidatus Cloacimonadota bacterium]